MKSIALRDRPAAIRLADEVALKASPSEVIRMMMMAYSHALFTPDDQELRNIYTGLPHIAEVTGILVRWSSAQNLPADIVPVIAYQLLSTKGADPRINVPPISLEVPQSNSGNITLGTLADGYRTATPPLRTRAAVNFLNEDEVL